MFGWLVRPRSSAEAAGGGDGQGSDHLKLQATISVPSWWRIVALEEVTCWARPDRLGAAFDAVRRGATPHAADLWHAIAEGAGVEGCRVRPASLTLPGKVVDISARLGIAVEQGPRGLEEALPPHQRWLARKMKDQARKWSVAEIDGALRGLLDVDRLVKAASHSDEHFLETWLLAQRVAAEAA